MTVRTAARQLPNTSHYDDDTSRTIARRHARAPYPAVNARSDAQNYLSDGSAASMDKLHFHQLPSSSHSPRKTYRISTRRIKRVPVTSCDSCRLRKLKCNAKDLPRGATCSQCRKHDSPCTFEDRDEVASVPVRKASVGVRTTPAPTSDHGNPRSGQLEHDNTTRHARSAYQLPPLRASNTRQATFAAMDLGAYSLGAASIQGGSEYDEQTYTTSTDRQMDVGATLRAAWHHLGMPISITDGQSNEVQMTDVPALLSILATRFTADHESFHNLVVPSRIAVADAMNRMCETGVPDYFVLTVVACAVLSDKTAEPELVQWRQKIWRHASEAVQGQVDICRSADSTSVFRTIQALLLLSTCWPGELTRYERINTFDAAVSLAMGLHLHSSIYLACGVGSASERVALFWFMYCYDKILSAATRRTISLPRISHDIPMIGRQDLSQLGLQLSSHAETCLQRLLCSFIGLCQILEGAQDCQQPNSLQDALQSSRMLTNKLERFRLDSEWFMGANIDVLPVICRPLAEAISSQMHLTRLEMYANHVRVDLSSKPTQPTELSVECHNSMGSSIESAWHLIQRSGGQQKFLAPSRFSATSFTSICFTFGSDFFRFLALNWSQWDGGRGCLSFQEPDDVAHDSFPAHSNRSISPSPSQTSTLCTVTPEALLQQTDTVTTIERPSSCNSVDGEVDDEEDEVLTLPDKTNSLTQCDTAALFSLIINSPAAQFFSQSRSDSPPRSPLKAKMAFDEHSQANPIMSVQGNLLSSINSDRPSTRQAIIA